MFFKKVIKNLINRIVFPNTYNNEVFVKYLKTNGAKIGKNTRFIAPKQTAIDPGRMDYINIGENCCLSKITILAHDYSWFVFADVFNDIIPDSGNEVYIGNNCFVGYQAIIMPGTHIGNNVIIGARSLVKGIIPDNTVWAGCPAKQICTLEEFYNKKKSLSIASAVYRAKHIKNLKQRLPTENEMGFFCFLFLPHTEDNYNKYLKFQEFNGIINNKKIKELWFSSVPNYENLNDFFVKNNLL